MVGPGTGPNDTVTSVNDLPLCCVVLCCDADWIISSPSSPRVTITPTHTGRSQQQQLSYTTSSRATHAQFASHPQPLPQQPVATVVGTPAAELPSSGPPPVHTATFRSVRIGGSMKLCKSTVSLAHFVFFFFSSVSVVFVFLSSSSSFS